MKSKLNISPRFLPALTSIVLLATQTQNSFASLASYDAAIAADHGGGAGPLPYEAVLLSEVVFDTTNSMPFDFGAISGDSTFEFILEGDPVGGGQDGFLAVGENAGDSLRYEQWDDTGQLGFTRGGVADNLFTPTGDPALVESPTVPTHVTYRWQDAPGRMELYIDGGLAGSIDGAVFALPAGSGHLGNNAGLTEGMLGTIHRVTTYNDALAPASIQSHATAWLTNSDPNIQVPASVNLTLDGSVQNLTLNIINSGETLALNISSVNVGGTDAGKFSITSALPIIIPPEGQSTLEYTFDPMGATGAISASLTFESDDPNDDEVTTELTGLIRDPQISAPAAIDFGESAAAATRMIEIANLGSTQDLNISSYMITGSGAGQFFVTGPASIPAMSAADIAVTFDPTGLVGAFSAQIEIISNDLVAPSTVIDLSGSAPLDEGFLSAYDSVIAADHGGGTGLHPYEAVLTTAVTFDTTNSAVFDFGTISGDATFEFILEGDPVGGGQDAYLAVGSNAGDNLRYEQWNDTGVLGFTRLGTADNVFTATGDAALLNSPEDPTHVTYAWDDAAPRMELYINGELAGFNDGAAFSMATGSGLLGNNAGGSEGMLGTIHRVTTYNNLLDADTVLRHALAFTTGSGGAEFKITSVTYDDSLNHVSIEWNSSSGVEYSIERSFDLLLWSELEDSIVGEPGDTTGYTDMFLPANTSKAYYRVFVP